MIGLIVTGHGNFASGMTSALTLIAGKPEAYQCVDFPQEYSVEDLEKQLIQALDSLSHCEGILMLSDLAGGTPFKSSVICSIDRTNVKVIAGTNLPMLIEIGLARQFMSELDDLTTLALQTGKDQVVLYQPNVTRHQVSDDLDDGI